MRRKTRSLLLGWALGLALAAPASALPITVYFDGPGGIGVDPSLVEAPGFPVPIVMPDFIGSIAGVFSVTQSFDQSSIDPSPPTLPNGPNKGSSQWTVEALLELNGSTWFFFRTAVPYTIASFIFDYDDENVGLTIDPDLGWVMVKEVVGSDTYYLPAVSLGALLAGETASFWMHYVVNEPLLQSPIPKGEYVYPRMEVGLGFTPIPEPGAGLLLASGLLALAAARRRRS